MDSNDQERERGITILAKVCISVRECNELTRRCASRSLSEHDFKIIFSGVGLLTSHD